MLTKKEVKKYAKFIFEEAKTKLANKNSTYSQNFISMIIDDDLCYDSLQVVKYGGGRTEIINKVKELFAKELKK